MAAKPQPPVTPDGKQASAAAMDAVAAAKAEQDEWSDLAAPVAMESKSSPGSIKVDVLTTVPEPIRQRAESSLAINVERVKAKASSKAKRARINYAWQLQQVASKEQGDKFVKLIEKYAKYRPSEGDIPHAGPNSPKGQATARCGNVLHFRKVADDEYIATDAKAEGAFLGVRYSVRPLEQRGDARRLPGTAS